jgi:hypothetical protein
MEGVTVFDLGPVVRLLRTTFAQEACQDVPVHRKTPYPAA